MRVICLLGFLLLMVSAGNAIPVDELNLSITLVRGEHSRDSNETTRTLSLTGDQAVYNVSFSGRRGPSQQPVNKTITLTKDDIKRIKKLLGQRSWYPAEKREFVRTGAMNYFSITLTAGKSKGATTILLTGTPGNPLLGDDATYQYTELVLSEVFDILHDHDPEIEFVNVVN